MPDSLRAYYRENPDIYKAHQSEAWQDRIAELMATGMTENDATEYALANPASR